MSIRKELINLTIVNNSDCNLTIPLFQNNVASINATTKYSWDITTADLSCGFGSVIINSITYNITFDSTLTGLLSSLNGLNFGYFCSEIILGQLYVYTIDDTNIYGDLDLCPTPTTTTTSTTTTAIPTTTTTSTSTTSTSTTSTTTTAIPTTTTTSTSTSTTSTTTTAIPTTTTTSTSTSTTSTTTTSIIGDCYTIQNTDAVDISASYTDINGNPACQAVPVSTTVYICVQSGTGGSIVLYLGTGCLSGSGSGIITSLGTNCTISGDCIPTTTTSTTTSTTTVIPTPTTTTSTSTTTTTDIPTTTTTTSTSTTTTTDIPTTTTTTSTSTSTTTDIPTTTTTTSTSTSTTTDIPTTTTTTSTSTSTTTDIPTTTTTTSTSTSTTTLTPPPTTTSTTTSTTTTPPPQWIITINALSDLDISNMEIGGTSVVATIGSFPVTNSGSVQGNTQLIAIPGTYTLKLISVTSGLNGQSITVIDSNGASQNQAVPNPFSGDITFTGVYVDGITQVQVIGNI